MKNTLCTVPSRHGHHCLTFINICAQSASQPVCRARLQVAGWLQRCYCDAGSFARVPSRVDNPDQRIANDTELWAEQLGRLAPIFATAPLKVRTCIWPGMYSLYVSRSANSCIV